MKEPESGDLRLALEELSRGAEPRADCPPPETLWDAASGVLAASEISTVVLHTASCPSCARAWRMAADLSRQAEAADREEQQQVAACASGVAIVADSPSPPIDGSKTSQFRRWLPASLVAVVLAGLGGGALYQNWWNHNPERGNGTNLAIEALLPEGQPLSPDRFLLRWDGPPGASYEVTVMTEDLSRVIAKATGLDETEFLVAASDLGDLEAGARLLWRVVASLESGTKLPSPTFSATLE